MTDTFTLDPLLFVWMLGAVVAAVALYWIIRLAVVHAIRATRRGLGSSGPGRG